MSVDVKALIEKQRAKLAVVKQQTLEVMLGGEKVTLTFDRALPDVWDGLMAANPPRRGNEADATVGYNTKAVSVAYPGVALGDEVLDAGTWAELYDVLDSVHRNNIGVTIWGININESLREMQDAGKGSAGQK